MDKFVKRIQTRLSRKDVRVSKSQVREVYESVVAAPENPSEEEMSVVIEQLETQYQAPSYEVDEDALSIPEPSITEITPENHPDIWRTSQPPTEQPELTQQEEPQQMPLAQPAQQPSASTLATSNRSALSQTSDASTAITQEQIKQAVEQQFGKENLETKTAILNYVAQDTFATATELQQALSKLRQMRLDILMKLIADHNQASSSDENLLKTALLQASASRQQETADFFDSFENQLMQMRANFGI